MDLPVVLDGSDVVSVERLTDHVEHVTEDSVAHGHGDASSGLANDGPANESVGGLHAHAAHATLADLLGDLGGDRNRHAVKDDVHLDRVVDLGQRVRAGTPRPPPVRRSRRPVRSREWSFQEQLSLVSHFPERSASAPPTISMISVVIESWRARFMMRLRFWPSSSALSVAAAMARC